jgi:signal transduction histidine kinase
MEAMVNQSDQLRRITIGCHRYYHAVVVSVRDSGPGLNAGSEDMVFEPFYTTKAGGMGMGLSIVRSIVEAHGGIIQAINLEDGGALLEFQLPAIEGVPA